MAVRALTDDMGAALAALLRPFPPAPAAAPGRSWPPVAAVVLWPVFTLGVLLNGLPYRLPGWVAGALTRTPDEPATYKVITALLAFPLVWAAEVALAGRWGGPAWALAMLVMAPVSGYLALLVYEGRPKRC
jgi:hypothetical protein